MWFLHKRATTITEQEAWQRSLDLAEKEWAALKKTPGTSPRDYVEVALRSWFHYRRLLKRPPIGGVE